MKNVLQIRKLIIVALLLLISQSINAQPPYPVATIENFDTTFYNQNVKLPAGWIDSNFSTPSPDPNHLLGGWSIGPDSLQPAQNATGLIHGLGYIDSTTDGFLFSRGDSACLDRFTPFAIIDNWVFSPVDSITDNTTISYWTTTDSGLINNQNKDTLEVYYSLNGASTDTSDFSPWPTLIQGFPFPSIWTHFSGQMNNTLVPTPSIGRIAFRHRVRGDAIGALSWVIAIDNVYIETFPLPISLSKFTCNPDKYNNVNLHWETESENNSNFFVVERSIDGKNFTPLGNVKAAGNSTIKQNYSFRDLTATSAGYNKVFYRLKQVDINGKYSYSFVIQASLTNTGVSNMLNPYLSGNTLHIRYVVTNADVVNIQVLNTNGQVVAERNQETAEGLNTATMDFSSMPSGIYIVRVSGKTETLINRFVK